MTTASSQAAISSHVGNLSRLPQVERPQLSDHQMPRPAGVDLIPGGGTLSEFARQAHNEGINEVASLAIREQVAVEPIGVQPPEEIADQDTPETHQQAA